MLVDKIESCGVVMKESILIEIENRCNSTSCGDWFAEIEDRSNSWPGPYQLRGGIPLDFGWDGEAGIYGEKADFEFIAHARQDIPLLISEIRRLKKQITNQSRRHKQRAPDFKEVQV